MELSEQARKRAVEAFKSELNEALSQIRIALTADRSEWEGLAIKAVLHKIKGGAGFLGYEMLRQEVASLESEAGQFPQEPKKWFDFIASWDSKLDIFC